MGGDHRGGLIPAHAGKTRPCPQAWRWSGAHPRSRGENVAAELRLRVAKGSSPLTRGKPRAHRRPPGRAGLIPAHAGKTGAGRRPHPGGQAHPRSRGENMVARVGLLVSVGSSPLTRGKLPCLSGRGPCIGLIPAHAGKTVHRLQHRNMAWAHPRSRGENVCATRLVCVAQGSSPLTRGKLNKQSVIACARGLIPAHAGKTY